MNPEKREPEFELEVQEASGAGQEIEQEQEMLHEVSIDSVLEMTRALPSELYGADEATLSKKQEALKELPYFRGGDVRDVLDWEGEDEGMGFVDTNKIVGSVSPAFEDWSTEYDSRKGRAVAVAQELLESTPESAEQVFHLEEPNEQIKLKKISGPGGALFFAADGTHRIAACKLVELPEVPAQVEDMSNLSEINTIDKSLSLEWEERINRGLIRGSIEEVDLSEEGKKMFKLHIEEQTLPWMALPQNRLVQFSKFYESQYPGSFDDLEIPKGALVDQIGFNYFLAGRYGEYEALQQEESK